MSKKKNCQDEFKLLLKVMSYILSFGILLLLILQLYLEQHPKNPWELLQILFPIYLTSGIGLVLFISFAKLAIGIWHWLDRDSIQVFIKDLVLRFNFWRRSRNAEKVYPLLQNFLYHVLTQNKDFLPLPVGSDISCLTPLGKNYVYRNDCVFYRFQLVISETPNMPVSQIKQLFQYYIFSESRNHGIIGLYNIYQDFFQNSWDTVQIDRMWMDEENHILSFEILYVITEKASDYMLHVRQNEQSSKNTFYEVYDDEL